MHIAEEIIPIMGKEETYHSKIRPTRTKTLMEGNSYCNHIATDKENYRLFLSSNGIKIYNITNPSNLQLIGEIDDTSQGVMKYHDNHLFFINFTING